MAEETPPLTVILSLLRRAKADPVFMKIAGARGYSPEKLELVEQRIRDRIRQEVTQPRLERAEREKPTEVAGLGRYIGEVLTGLSSPIESSEDLSRIGGIYKGVARVPGAASLSRVAGEAVTLIPSIVASGLLSPVVTPLGAGAIVGGAREVAREKVQGEPVSPGKVATEAFLWGTIPRMIGVQAGLARKMGVAVASMVPRGFAKSVSNALPNLIKWMAPEIIGASLTGAEIEAGRQVVAGDGFNVRGILDNAGAFALMTPVLKVMLLDLPAKRKAEAVKKAEFIARQAEKALNEVERVKLRKAMEAVESGKPVDRVLDEILADIPDVHRERVKQFIIQGLKANEEEIGRRIEDWIASLPGGGSRAEEFIESVIRGQSQGLKPPERRTKTEVEREIDPRVGALDEFTRIILRAKPKLAEVPVREGQPPLYGIKALPAVPPETLAMREYFANIERYSTLEDYVKLDEFTWDWMESGGRVTEGMLSAGEFAPPMPQSELLRRAMSRGTEEGKSPFEVPPPVYAKRAFARYLELLRETNPEAHERLMKEKRSRAARLGAMTRKIRAPAEPVAGEGVTPSGTEPAVTKGGAVRAKPAKAEPVQLLPELEWIRDNDPTAPLPGATRYMDYVLGEFVFRKPGESISEFIKAVREARNLVRRNERFDAEVPATEKVKARMRASATARRMRDNAIKRLKGRGGCLG